MTDATQTTTDATQTPAFVLTTSRGFNNWLATVGSSLALSTYQHGKLFLLGLTREGKLSVLSRNFPRCMGMALSPDARTLLMATQVQLYRFDNVLSDAEITGEHDAVFLPNQTWITADIDIHDIGFGEGGKPVFANTLFNCLATTADGYSFRPLWRPPFISQLAAEDRCHLNGLAMDGTTPRYVTCVSQSDASDGWRDRRTESGVVVDVASGEVVASGLSMPHSPRLRDGKLWILNSGTGEFGWVDTESGAFNPITFCPGYARGMTFVGDYAVVGVSRARENRTFQGLALEDELKKRDVDARCGLLVIDLRNGDIVEWVRIEGVIDELFDVTGLPGMRCPNLVGIQGPEIRRAISIAPASNPPRQATHNPDRARYIAKSRLN